MLFFMEYKSMKNILIQGIQYDEKSSHQRGPRLAPPLIRKALHCGSMNLTAENGFTMDTPKVSDSGDFNIKSYFDIEDITTKHLQIADHVVSLGGDHSVTYPIIKAYQQRYPTLDILHIDAHPDLYDEFDGDKYSHASPFARIMESRLATRLVQVGIRTLNQHQRQQANKFDVEIHEMRTLNLSKIRTFENPLYISIDMDGLDPAFAPGVSHNEPGGLTTRQVINLIHDLDANVIGGDIVEYNPERDCNEMTAFVAAKLMKELIGKIRESNT